MAKRQRAALQMLYIQIAKAVRYLFHSVYFLVSMNFDAPVFSASKTDRRFHLRLSNSWRSEIIVFCIIVY